MLPLLTDTSGEVDQEFEVVDLSSLCQRPFGNPRSLCLSFLKGGILSEQFKDRLTDGCELGNEPADVL